MKIALPVLLTLAGAYPTVAQDYVPVFDPGRLDDGSAGPANEVVVLGTPHLSQMPEGFRIEMVEPLVDHLAEWNPTAVSVENNSGLLCDKMRRMPDRYEDAIERYCVDPSVAEAATGLDVPAANLRAETLLAQLEVDPKPSTRRELAAVFLAAGEPGSAVVQWLRLPEVERHTDGVLNEELVSLLRYSAGRKSETYSVAAKVAARSGLDRLWSVDDQSTYMGELKDEDAFGDAIMAAWNNPATKSQSDEADTLVSGLDRPGGLLAIYRA